MHPAGEQTVPAERNSAARAHLLVDSEMLFLHNLDQHRSCLLSRRRRRQRPRKIIPRRRIVFLRARRSRMMAVFHSVV